MISQKLHIENPHGGGWFNRELKLLGLFLALISCLNLVFSNNSFALYVPTLSASVDNSAVSVNGNQVINSVLQTSELPIRVTVKTNNKTGYTATLNTETDETALVNSNSVSGAKINSIDTSESLTNFSQNTWGFLSPSSGNYQPIPGLSNSANLFSTTAKTSGNENFDFKIGMKLADNLESGNYTNKLVISIVSNPYERRAVMTTGKDFNDKMQAFDPQRAGESSNGFRIKHFKRSVAEPVASDNAIGVESADLSDYEIKLWFNLAEETMYYYSPVETTFLNPNSAAMFAWFIKLQDIDLSHFNTSEVENMMQMFVGLYSCTSLDLSTFDTRNVTSMYQMFAHDRSLVNLNLANFNTWLVTDMAGMFEDLSNVVSLDLSSFDTYNVTDMKWMFYGLNKLKKLDLANFDTSMVTNMYGMFDQMADVSEIKFGSNFNTKNVVNMGRMFAVNLSIQNLDLSSFNTGKVTTMNDMFNSMTSLTHIDFGANFDTSNVTDMTGMFYQSTSLVNLDLSHFNTRKVKSMNSMFSQMSGLTILDISNFETPSLEDAGSMFAIDPGFSDNLEKIYVNQDFDTSKLTSSTNAFIRRNRLRGGNGSFLSDPSTADKTWLRVDRPGVQGYFTRKS